MRQQTGQTGKGINKDTHTFHKDLDRVVSTTDMDRTKAETKAIISAMFVFGEALEMIIKEVVDGKPEDNLKGKAKIYYKQYKSALRTAQMSMAGFNLEIERMIYEIDDKGDKIDHFRRLANDMIRLYCHYRNCDVSKEENAKEFEQKAMEMNRISLISEDSVKKFTLR